MSDVSPATATSSPGVAKPRPVWDSLAPPALLALILGLVYWRTLLPVVGYWGDMAKFDFLGQVWGTSHLSGYPTYTILNGLFVRLFPWGSLAQRANLLSALFSILAVLFVYASLRLLEARRAAAFTAALAFGFTYSLWTFSLVAEVYTLNALFTAATIYTFLRWRLTRRAGDLYLACAVYAFSFGNHLTMIALLPAIAGLVWQTERRAYWDPRRIIPVLLLVGLGFAQYGYIAWRTNDPTTPYLETNTARFLELLRQPAGGQNFTHTPLEIVTQRLPLYFSYLWREYGAWLLLAALGLAAPRWRRGRAARRTAPALGDDPAADTFLLLCGLGNTLFALQFDLHEWYVYFLPTYLILAIYVGRGLNDLTGRALAWRPGWPAHRLEAGLAVMGLLVPALLLSWNYRAVDQSQHTLHARIVEKILHTVPRDAILIADDYDYACYFWYYLLGEGYERSGLYSLPVAFTGGKGIAAYLAEGQPMSIPPLRLETPPGLPVYALWTLADRLGAAGLQVEPTETKYLYRVKLPGDRPPGP